MAISFDVKRENEIIAAGGFWCHTCLMGRPAVEKSSDPRYCLSCYEVLKNEFDLIKTVRERNYVPPWVPQDLVQKTPRTPLTGIKVMEKATVTPKIVAEHGRRGVTPEILSSIKELLAQGQGTRTIGVALGISHMKVSRVRAKLLQKTLF